MKFYGYWRSSASWRVRIALAHKELAYEYVPVHLVRGGGEQHSEAHRARNPMAQVPVLELDDGTYLSQSLAIIEYLDEVHPDPPLLPAEPLARARARQMAEIANSGIQPLQNSGTAQKLKELGVDAQPWSAFWITKGLDSLEAAARSFAGTFCVGDQVSVADLCLIPQLYSARRFDLEISRWPTLARIEEACGALPAFVAAHADSQPDANVPA